MHTILRLAQVVLKRKYMDSMKHKDKIRISGHEWYQLQAARAVNQAIGRVIRHRHDYGAIILLDARFSSKHAISQLPLWLRNQVEVRLGGEGRNGEGKGRGEGETGEEGCLSCAYGLSARTRAAAL